MNLTEGSLSLREAKSIPANSFSDDKLGRFESVLSRWAENSDVSLLEKLPKSNSRSGGNVAAIFVARMSLDARLRTERRNVARYHSSPSTNPCNFQRDRTRLS